MAMSLERRLLFVFVDHSIRFAPFLFGGSVSRCHSLGQTKCLALKPPYEIFGL